MWVTGCQGAGSAKGTRLGKRALSLSFPEKEIKRKSRRGASCQLHGAVQENAVFLLVCWSNRELPFAVIQQPKMNSLACLSYQKTLKHNIENLSGCERDIKLLFKFERGSLAFKNFVWWPFGIHVDAVKSLYLGTSIHNIQAVVQQRHHYSHLQ